MVCVRVCRDLGNCATHQALLPRVQASIDDATARLTLHPKWAELARIPSRHVPDRVRAREMVLQIRAALVGTYLNIWTSSLVSTLDTRVSDFFDDYDGGGSCMMVTLLGGECS